jgi:DNA (cytosine-5)-methyltransferase 1
MYRVLSLFAGIGGFDLGLERTGGFRTVAFCEIDPFCQRVLAKHWPSVPCYDDVRTLTGERLASDGIEVDCIVGGFPCQDLSRAGKRHGLAGERSGLWSEFARLIGDLRPRYILVENVPELLVRGMGRVLGDLAAIGYDAEWEGIPAAAVGAPQLRARQWILAYPAGLGDRLEASALQAGRDHPRLCHWWDREPDVGRVDDGPTAQVDRLRSLGNAVVPQIPEMIGRAILAADAERLAA